MNAGFLRPAPLVVHTEMRRDESQMIVKFWVLKLLGRGKDRMK